MQRKFSELGTRPFDLLVVGGGIYGCWAAYDAAMRGLSVALVERNDWGCGTSSASSKLIHGGLRYLEHAQFSLVRKTLAERRRLWKLGPHRVRPLRFVLPRYTGDRVGRMKMQAGLWLYDRLAFGTDQPVDPHRHLNRRDVMERYPFLRRDGLKGGFLFGDCQTDDARFTLEIAEGAASSGVVAVNRAEVRELLTQGGKVVGAVVHDLEDGETTHVRAGLTLNCAGPSGSKLVRLADPQASPKLRLTKGVHLVLPGLPTRDAVLLTSRADRRIVFLLPWYGRTLVGTTDTDHDGDPDNVRVEPEDVDYLLTQANRVLHGAVAWNPSDIVSSYAGLRTLRERPGRLASSLSRELSLEQPLDGMMMPVGGKLTSAREDAAQIVDAVLKQLGRANVACATSELALPWAPDFEYPAWSRDVLNEALHLGLDEETARTCVRRYGSRIDRVFDRIRADPDLAHRAAPDAPFCRAEIVEAVEAEMAGSLEDILRRRVPLMLVSRIGPEILEDLSTLVARTAGWSEQRRHDEVAALGTFRFSRQFLKPTSAEMGNPAGAEASALRIDD